MIPDWTLREMRNRVFMMHRVLTRRDEASREKVTFTDRSLRNNRQLHEYPRYFTEDDRVMNISLQDEPSR